MKTQSVLSVVKSWLKMYDFQWGKQSDGDIQKAWAVVFKTADPDMLNQAFEEAFKNSEYYPTPDAVKGFLKAPRRDGTAWIPPADGECRADELNCTQLPDGRSMACACRKCRPDLPWCRWQYADGTFCSRYDKENRAPYCWEHHTMAVDNFDLITLDVGDQISYLRGLEQQGQLIFRSDQASPLIKFTDFGPCTNRREFHLALVRLSEMKGFPKTKPEEHDVEHSRH